MRERVFPRYSFDFFGFIRKRFRHLCRMLSRTCDFFSFNCCSFKVRRAFDHVITLTYETRTLANAHRLNCCNHALHHVIRCKRPKKAQAELFCGANWESPCVALFSVVRVLFKRSRAIITPFYISTSSNLCVVIRFIFHQNSFTLEASLCGPDIGRRCAPPSAAVFPTAFRDKFHNCDNIASSLKLPEAHDCNNRCSSCCHFNISHYLHLGFCFCDVILDFWDPDQVLQSHTRTSFPHRLICHFEHTLTLCIIQSHFNAVLQELVASGDSLGEAGGGDSDSAEGRFARDHETRIT